MDLGIEGETALILGGTQGLALACAESLREAGVRIVINGRNAETGAAAAEKLGDAARFIQGDISDPDERVRIFDDATAVWGPISILVNNAGGPPPGRFGDHDRATWLAAIETNMLAAIDLTERCLPAMTARGFGRIVNITSFAVREPYPNLLLANSVRAGLHGAMSTLAREVAQFGVTVNNLLPGLMDTPALQRVYRAQSLNENISEDDAKARMADSIPTKRLGTAEDFGPMCAFLCSRHASYMTAQNITIDGGLVRALL